MADNRYIPLGEATGLCPVTPSKETLVRWARKGVLGRNGQRIALEHRRFGGRLYTTRAWVEAFYADVQRADREALLKSLGAGRAGG